jgi:hypothetical protein
MVHFKLPKWQRWNLVNGKCSSHWEVRFSGGRPSHLAPGHLTLFLSHQL